MRDSIRTIPFLKFAALSIMFSAFHADAVAPVELPGYTPQNPYIDTIRTVFFEVHNPDDGFWARQYPDFTDFSKNASLKSLEILPGHPELPYSLWINNAGIDLVVILPGLGASHINMTAFAMAELFYLQGKSVVVVGNPMNWQFHAAASTVDAPGYTPFDSADLRRVLRLLTAEIQSKYPERTVNLQLAGYSHGALHTLRIADLEAGDKSKLFSRYLAVNPPVNLLHCLLQVDSMLYVWRDKSREQLDSDFVDGAAKYMAVLKSHPNLDAELLFSVEEAQFLVGYNFHRVLGELLLSIHRTKPIPAIQAQYSWFNRKLLYDEVWQFNYYTYIKKIVLPVCSRVIGKELSLDDANRNSGLPAIMDTLLTNQDIRVIQSADDFLLTDVDREWLSGILGNRLTVFSNGAHLGNLYRPEVKKAMVDALIDIGHQP